MLRQSFPFLVLALSLLSGGGVVHAQSADALTLKVQPSTIEEAVEPGGILNGTLRITNLSALEEEYYLGKRNVSGVSDAGRPSFSDADANDPLSPTAWISTDVGSVVVSAGETKEVGYTIRVPQDATPGSHLAALFVTREADRQGETGAGVGFNVASLIVLRVAGDVVEDFKLLEFSTTRAVYTTPLVDFSLRVQNEGTVVERPQGFIVIYDMLGNEVAQVPVNSSKGAVLPSAERHYKELRWESERLAFGRYHAVATVVFGESARRSLSEELSFWVLSWEPIVYGVGALLAALLIFFGGTNLYIRSVLRKAGHTPQAKARATKEVTFVRRLVRTLSWVFVLLLLLLMGFIVFSV